MNIDPSLLIRESIGVGKFWDQKDTQSYRELYHNIKKGKYSTGNKIKDFLIVHCGLLPGNEWCDEELKKKEKEVKNLERMADDFQGEQVLVINHHLTIGGCDVHYTLIEELKLGFLDGKIDYDIRNEQIIFPTKNHVERIDYVRDPEWELKKGSINAYDFRNFNSRLPSKIVLFRMIEESNGSGRSQRILMGNEIAELYFKIPHAAKISFWLFYDKGEMKDEKFREEFLEAWRNLDLSYASALGLLGKEIPEEFKIGVEESQSLGT